MTKPLQEDKSNGYEEAAEDLMRSRNSLIGPATVRAWSRTLPRGASSTGKNSTTTGGSPDKTRVSRKSRIFDCDACPTAGGKAYSILDLGCGHGVPISQALINEGFAVYGVDASAKMIAAFRERFPDAHAECSSVEDSEFFNITFDGVVAWGLMFLLSPAIQTLVILKVARALNPGGKFLFTSPRGAVTWTDVLTRRESISLGFQAYQEILLAEGLVLTGEQSDDGENHYYLVSKR